MVSHDSHFFSSCLFFLSRQTFISFFIIISATFFLFTFTLFNTLLPPVTFSLSVLVHQDSYFFWICLFFVFSSVFCFVVHNLSCFPLSFYTFILISHFLCSLLFLLFSFGSSRFIFLLEFIFLPAVSLLFYFPSWFWLLSSLLLCSLILYFISSVLFLLVNFDPSRFVFSGSLYFFPLVSLLFHFLSLLLLLSSFPLYSWILYFISLFPRFFPFRSVLAPQDSYVFWICLFSFLSSVFCFFSIIILATFLFPIIIFNPIVYFLVSSLLSLLVSFSSSRFLCLLNLFIFLPLVSLLFPFHHNFGYFLLPFDTLQSYTLAPPFTFWSLLVSQDSYFFCIYLFFLLLLVLFRFPLSFNTL